MTALKILPGVGRPHHVSRERHPSGEVKRRVRGDTRTLTQFHRAVATGKFPEIANQVGMLVFRDVLNESQGATAHDIGEIYHRYNRLQPYARRFARSPNYERSGGEAPDITETGSLEMIEELQRRIAEAKAEWDLVQKCYPHQRAREFIEELCVYDRTIHSSYHRDLRVVLDKVAERLEAHRNKREKAK